MKAKEFLKQKGLPNVHQGNIEYWAKLLEEYSKIKFQEYFKIKEKIK
jgi:hypothetical protein